LQPNSQYAADAKFQLGETYLNLEQDDKARCVLRPSGDQYPNSPHVRQSMLQSALIDKRQGRVDKALDGFKAVVAKYPTADGAHDALAGIERIYVEQGKVAAYEAYVRSLSFVDPPHWTWTRTTTAALSSSTSLSNATRPSALSGITWPSTPRARTPPMPNTTGPTATTATERPQEALPGFRAHRGSQRTGPVAWNPPSQRLPPSNMRQGAWSAHWSTTRSWNNVPRCR
jgi:tetratricopeptide (TPR) repeat protein